LSQNYGWRSTFICLAVFAGAVVFPLLVIVVSVASSTTLWQLVTVSVVAPIPNTLVPSAPRCVGLADPSVMPPQERKTHCSSYSYSFSMS
jgi:hypothetical protein